MTQEEKSAIVQNLNDVFRFIEDLADEESQRLKLFINARGFKDEDEPTIYKTEAKIEAYRNQAEKIQKVIDLLLDEQ